MPEQRYLKKRHMVLNPNNWEKMKTKKERYECKVIEIFTVNIFI